MLIWLCLVKYNFPRLYNKWHVFSIGIPEQPKRSGRNSTKPVQEIYPKKFRNRSKSLHHPRWKLAISTTKQMPFMARGVELFGLLLGFFNLMCVESEDTSKSYEALSPFPHNIQYKTCILIYESKLSVSLISFCQSITGWTLWTLVQGTWNQLFVLHPNLGSW